MSPFGACGSCRAPAATPQGGPSALQGALKRAVCALHAAAGMPGSAPLIPKVHVFSAVLIPVRAMDAMHANGILRLQAACNSGRREGVERNAPNRTTLASAMQKVHALSRQCTDIRRPCAIFHQISDPLRWHRVCSYESASKRKPTQCRSRVDAIRLA